jgi:predicted nucleic acid-binding protein
LPEHPNYTQALQWLQRVHNNEVEGFISTHTIAELYSVLTRLPRNPRISPITAQQLIAGNLTPFTKVVLNFEDYQAVLSRMVSLNLPGGGIYDALIAQAAIKAQVALLLTLNPNDFSRLGEDIAQLVQVPT